MTTQSADGGNPPAVGEKVIRRILWLTPANWIAASVVALLLRRVDWAGGLLVGAALAWLNFRWLVGD